MSWLLSLFQWGLPELKVLQLCKVSVRSVAWGSWEKDSHSSNRFTGCKKSGVCVCKDWVKRAEEAPSQGWLMIMRRNAKVSRKTRYCVAPVMVMGQGLWTPHAAANLQRWSYPPLYLGRCCYIYLTVTNYRTNPRHDVYSSLYSKYLDRLATRKVFVKIK